MFLNNAVKSKDSKFQQLVRTVAETVGKHELSTILGKVTKMWGIDEQDIMDQRFKLKEQKREQIVKNFENEPIDNSDILLKNTNLPLLKKTS